MVHKHEPPRRFIKAILVIPYCTQQTRLRVKQNTKNVHHSNASVSYLLCAYIYARVNKRR